MKPIYPKHENNFFPACVASILEIPIEDVIDFTDSKTVFKIIKQGWRSVFRGWCFRNDVLYIEIPKESFRKDFCSSGYCILVGPNQYRPNHCIVGEIETDGIIRQCFDPDKREEYLDSIKDIIFVAHGSNK